MQYCLPNGSIGTVTLHPLPERYRDRLQYSYRVDKVFTAQRGAVKVALKIRDADGRLLLKTGQASIEVKSDPAPDMIKQDDDDVIYF